MDLIRFRTNGRHRRDTNSSVARRLFATDKASRSCQKKTDEFVENSPVIISKSPQLRPTREVRVGDRLYRENALPIIRPGYQF